MESKVTVKRAPEIIQVEEPGSRRKQRTSTHEDESETSLKRPHQEWNGPEEEMDVKKCKLEVKKFVMKHSKKEEKQEAMATLLISLGAKPPKKKALNIKEWREEKRKEEEARVNAGEPTPQDSGSQKKKRQRRRPKKNSDFFDGQVGRYSNGVQYVSKKDFVK